MELGIVEDDRNIPTHDDFQLKLTAHGIRLREALFPHMRRLGLEFKLDGDGVPSTRMEDADYYNTFVKEVIEKDQYAGNLLLDTLLGMHAVRQMLEFIYQICRKKTIGKQEIYTNFFDSPSVKRFCEREGIEDATVEGARHRCPFLLNILEALGVLNIGNSDVTVKKLFLVPQIVQPHLHEAWKVSRDRMQFIRLAWPDDESKIDAENLSICKELFGQEILSNKYFLDDIEIYELEK